MGKIKDIWTKVCNWVRKALSWLFGFSTDKYLHLIAGAAITALCALIPYLAPFALTFGVVAGVIKEIVDYFDDGNLDAVDAVFTAVGAFAMQICIWGYLLIW